MNVLCQLLWENKQLPTVETVIHTWHNYVKIQRPIIAHDIIELSANQQKILSALAKKPERAVQSTTFTSHLKISSSSAQQAIHILLAKDLIFKGKDDVYQVLDPAIKYYLNTILWEP